MDESETKNSPLLQHNVNYQSIVELYIDHGKIFYS